MKQLPTKKTLLHQIDRFPHARIMVVGDLMIDHFIWGNVNRISPEAPVPVVNVTSESLCLGGAANVMHNIRTLGGTVFASGLAGDDTMGRRILKNLKSLSIATDGIIIANGRPTTVKTRIIAHNQQVVRFDREEIAPLPSDATEKLFSSIKRAVSKIDAILISDYGKGLVSAELMEELVCLTKKTNKPIVVDPKVKNIDIYKGVTVITPNQSEASQALGVKIVTDVDSSQAASLLKKKIGCESVLITRGEQGMTLLEKNGACTHIPTLATEIYDVTGAGDTVASVLTLGITTGATLRVSAILANYAAGIVVRKVGTATVDREELKTAINKQDFIVNHAP